MIETSEPAETSDGPSQVAPSGARRWSRGKMGIAMIALEAAVVIVALKGFKSYFLPPPTPPLWVDAGKPVTLTCALNPTGTTTIDVKAEDAVDVCVFNAEGQGQLDAELVNHPLSCSKNRTQHSIRINRWPAVTTVAIENPHRTGRVSIELLKTVDTTASPLPGTPPNEPSITAAPR